MTTLTPKKIIPPKEDRSVSKKTFKCFPKFAGMDVCFHATQVSFFIMEVLLRTFALGSFGERNLEKGPVLGGVVAMAKVGFSKRVEQIYRCHIYSPFLW